MKILHIPTGEIYLYYLDDTNIGALMSLDSQWSIKNYPSEITKQTYNRLCKKQYIYIWQGQDLIEYPTENKYILDEFELINS